MSDEARPTLQDYSDAELADVLADIDTLDVAELLVVEEAIRRLRERDWPHRAQPS